MRLFLIPISTRRTLIYGQRLNKVTHPTPSRADKLSARAAQFWLKWETSGKAWQKRLATYGNKLFNRIPFEEWGLKSIPPLSARRHQSEIQEKRVEVIYPPSIIDEKSVPKIIQQISTERNRLHRQRLVWSLIGMPIMAPVGLIPLVPNIPFFYLAYRAFSHWKALSGAEHLEFLVRKNLLLPTKSNSLDSVYAAKIAGAGLQNKQRLKYGEGREEVLLIRDSDASAIAEVVNVPSLVVECERAARQVTEQLLKETQQAHAKEVVRKTEKIPPEE